MFVLCLTLTIHTHLLTNQQPKIITYKNKKLYKGIAAICSFSSMLDFVEL